MVCDIKIYVEEQKMKRSNALSLIYERLVQIQGHQGYSPECLQEYATLLLSDLEEAGMEYIDNSYHHGWEPEND